MKIYHNPRCRKSREGVQYLTDKKLNFEISTRSNLGKLRLYLTGYPIATDNGLIMSGKAKFAKTDPSL